MTENQLIPYDWKQLDSVCPACGSKQFVKTKKDISPAFRNDSNAVIRTMTCSVCWNKLVKESKND